MRYFQSIFDPTLISSLISAIGNQMKDQDYFQHSEKKMLLDAIGELEDRAQDTRQEIIKNSDNDYWVKIIGVLLMIGFAVTMMFFKIARLVEFIKRRIYGAGPQPPEVPIELTRQGRPIPKITY